MKWLLPLALLAINAFAADLTGAWKGTADLNGDTIERTFNFKQDGAALTGETVSQRTGKSEIKNGKVDGDNVSFSIDMNFDGNTMKMNYTGKLDGETLKLKAESPDGGFSLQYTAKRAK